MTLRWDNSTTPEHCYRIYCDCPSGLIVARFYSIYCDSESVDSFLEPLPG